MADSAIGLPRLGCAVLLHGFSRGPRHLRVLSATLNSAGVATVRPALSAWDWSHGINNSRFLTRVAARIGAGLPAGPVVVFGHSAGAAAGAWIAADLLDSGVDVRRLVMADGVESPAGLVRRAWEGLQPIDVVDVVGDPSRCNRHGELADWLQRQDRPSIVVPISGGGHGDIEVERSLVYEWACGDDSSDAVRQVVLETVVTATIHGLTRDR